MIHINVIQKLLGFNEFSILIHWDNNNWQGERYKKTVRVKARNEVKAIEKAYMTYLYPDKGTMQVLTINGEKQEELNYE